MEDVEEEYKISYRSKEIPKEMKKILEVMKMMKVVRR